jgi:hypothetical protein
MIAQTSAASTLYSTVSVSAALFLGIIFISKAVRNCQKIEENEKCLATEGPIKTDAMTMLPL